jgi:AmiR/NasT family two-component response regulator
MVDQGRILERLRVLEILEEIAQEFSRKDELERYIAKVKKVLNERA